MLFHKDSNLILLASRWKCELIFHRSAIQSASLAACHHSKEQEKKICWIIQVSSSRQTTLIETFMLDCCPLSIIEIIAEVSLLKKLCTRTGSWSWVSTHRIKPKPTLQVRRLPQSIQPLVISNSYLNLRIDSRNTDFPVLLDISRRSVESKDDFGLMMTCEDDKMTFFSKRPSSRVMQEKNDFPYCTGKVPILLFVAFWFHREDLAFKTSRIWKKLRHVFRKSSVAMPLKDQITLAAKRRALTEPWYSNWASAEDVLSPASSARTATFCGIHHAQKPTADSCSHFCRWMECTKYGVPDSMVTTNHLQRSAAWYWQSYGNGTCSTMCSAVGL